MPMKTHSLLGKDHGYPTISVKATLGVIYIVRDPRDVVVSAADHYGLTIDQAIEMMADHRARGRGTPGNTVHELMGRWSEHVRSWTGGEHTRSEEHTSERQSLMRNTHAVSR